MKLYVVRSKDGKFFKPKGSGYGNQWRDIIDEAKFYTKIGQAKARITFWFKNYPKYGCPDLLEFDIDPLAANVIDIVNTTFDNIKKKKIKKLKDQIKYKATYESTFKSEINKLQSQIDNLNNS